MIRASLTCQSRYWVARLWGQLCRKGHRKIGKEILKPVVEMKPERALLALQRCDSPRAAARTHAAVVGQPAGVQRSGIGSPVVVMVVAVAVVAAAAAVAAAGRPAAAAADTGIAAGSEPGIAFEFDIALESRAGAGI